MQLILPFELKTFENKSIIFSNEYGSTLFEIFWY